MDSLNLFLHMNIFNELIKEVVFREFNRRISRKFRDNIIKILLVEFGEDQSFCERVANSFK